MIMFAQTFSSTTCRLAAARSKRGTMPDSSNGMTVTAGEARIPALGCGTWQLRGELCAKIVAEALRLGFPPHRHRAGLWQRGRGGRRDARFRRAARRRVRHHQGAAATRLRRPAAEIGRGEPEAAAVSSEIDLLLMHWPNPPFRLARAWRALTDAKRRGLTRHIGVSNFTVAMLDEAMRLSASRSSPTRSNTIPISTRRKSSPPTAATASPPPPIARSRSARWSAIRCSARSRRRIGKTQGPGRAPLAGPAGRRHRHTANIEAGAPARKSRDLRLSIDCRGNGSNKPPPAPGTASRQRTRLGAGMGLSAPDPTALPSPMARSTDQRAG